MALVPKCAPGHSKDIHVCLDPGKPRYFEALTISSRHFCKNQRKVWIIDSFLPKVPLVKVQGLKIPGFTGDLTYIDISSLVIWTFWHQSSHFMPFYWGVLGEKSEKSLVKCSENAKNHLKSTPYKETFLLFFNNNVHCFCFRIVQKKCFRCHQKIKILHILCLILVW